MQKFGTLTLKDTNQKFDIIWNSSSTSSGFCRIDVIKNLNDYQLIDTSNCDAAYYSNKGHTKYYGEKSIIARILNTINTASTFRCELKQETNIADGKIQIIQSKESEKLGLRWYTVLDFGNISEELFETEDTQVLFDSVNAKAGIESKPINLSAYEDFDKISRNKTVDKSSGDWYSLEYLKQTYDLEHMKNYDFVVVDSMVSAIARLEQFKNADTKVKAIDLETTGLEWCMLGKDVLVGVVLSWNENESTYYPFRQENFKYNLPISFLNNILDVVNNQPEDVKIIGHNAKVEKQGIWKESKYYIGNSDYARKWDENWFEHALVNPDLRIDGDSMLLSILVNPEFKKGTHSLKKLAERLRKVVFLELKNVFKNKKDIQFNVLPPEIVKYYACPDTANTIYIWNRLIKELPEDEFGILELETRMIPITAEMEFFGMRTQREYLIKAIENEQYIVDMLADMFKQIHRISANINSNDVRREIFYTKLRAPIKVRTKTGAPSTSSIALKAIIESGHFKIKDESKIAADIVDMYGNTVVKGKDLSSNKYPSLIILQAYAKHFKELGALKRIERKSKEDRVYFSLNQAGAATGRATSDAHQYSDAMKKAIMADSDEYNLWSADFKQVELRILPFVAGQQDLIELEKDPDVDVHRAILSLLTKKPIWAISADERKKGKSTNFGVVYMMSAVGLARKNKGPDYSDADKLEAQNSITGFYNGFPQIKVQTERNKYEATHFGYLRNRFGRRRYFKQLLDPEIDEKTRSSLIRAANNFPIQSFGADLLKICQCNVNDYIKEKGWDKLVETNGRMMPLVRMMLPIHDEILVSSHKSIPIEEIITMFKVCMEVKIAGAPPFFSAPAKVGCWYDGKLDKYELDLKFRDEIVEAWESGKRLIHCYSYDDSMDWKEAENYQKDCAKLRNELIDKFGKDNVTSKECRKEVLDYIGERVFKLTKHYTLNNSLDLMIERLMDPEFDWYLQDLSDYRNNRLSSYMNDLIQKYRTVDEVAKHVQHPELTHTLISIKIGKDEKFDHMTAIHEAVRRYMEDSNVDYSVDIKLEDAMDVQSIEDFEGLTKFMEFDENGEVIEPEDDGYEEDAVEDDITINELTPSKRTYCTFTLREVIVDLSDFDDLPKTAEEVNQAIGRISSHKEFYNVVYLLHGKLLKSKLKIGYIPDEIDDIINYWKGQIGKTTVSVNIS